MDWLEGSGALEGLLLLLLLLLQLLLVMTQAGKALPLWGETQ